MRIEKHAAAVIVDKSLGRRALGQDHVMRLELDVEIFDALDLIGLQDRDAIDQILGFDQHTIEIHGVMRRDEEIASRHVVAERSRLEANRQETSVGRSGGSGFLIGAVAATDAAPFGSGGIDAIAPGSANGELIAIRRLRARLQ
jgi:hypothetical protein